MKIAIIDDVALARKNYKNAIEKFIDLPIEILEASNSEEAYELYKDVEGIDICIMDIDLGAGKRNGIEAMKEIRTRRPDIKFIVITGMSGESYFFESMTSGASYFLVKPVDLIKLVELIKGMI